MRILGIVALGAALVGCAASRQEVAARLGDQFIGQNVDFLSFSLARESYKWPVTFELNDFLFNLPERTTVCSVVICSQALRVWLRGV